jgi:BolA family transcriptional regulator, general stress-responsive regulator
VNGPVPTDRVGRMRSLLMQEFAPRRLEITDDSAAHVGHAGAREGGHFRVQIVSDRFRSHTLLQRHRLVYTALADLLDGQIHALSIRALTPEELSDDNRLTN